MLGTVENYKGIKKKRRNNLAANYKIIGGFVYEEFKPKNRTGFYRIRW